MLNAFNAHSIFELTAKDRFKIDSLLAYGTELSSLVAYLAGGKERFPEEEEQEGEAGGGGEQ